MAEIDSLLQTVMFTIYGNQYESREEHLLLDHVSVRSSPTSSTTPPTTPLYSAEHPSFSHDDHLHKKRPRSELLEAGSCGADQLPDRVKDVDLEINPLKVYESMVKQIEEDTGSLPDDLTQGVTAEDAAENEQVQAIIAPRLKMLTEIANGFLFDHHRGLEETPYGIRWICKQIRSSVEAEVS